MKSYSLKAVIAVITCVSVFTVTLGIVYPLLALILEDRGVSKTLIGINGGMIPMGLMLSAFVIPHIASKIEPFRLVSRSVLLAAILLGLISSTRQVAIWFPLCFFLGCAVNGLFVVSEAWINQLTPDSMRGRILGMYTSVLILGYAVGPTLLSLTGIKGNFPFLLGIILIVSSFFPLYFCRRNLKGFQRKSKNTVSVVSFLPLAPKLLVGFGAIALLDNASMSLLPIYALSFKVSETVATRMLATLLFGGLLFQYPIGWLADRYSYRIMTIASTIVTLAGCIFLPTVILNNSLVWLYLLLWGGAAFGIYTMTLAELGARFKGDYLIAGSAALAMTWGVTTFIGVPLTGILMDLIGSVGFLFGIGTLYFIFLLMILSENLFATYRR